ncbi:type II toxin-antitoxin system PemK/MazF family toxin [Bosea sp. LjRoot237]|uniref:type II toxin-antitoxin system PemK/MazF family toxin n=1 Tax=Bosea sp. LjRoot237 TaxID=3342292 RepID=UPI003ECF5FB2
MPTFEQGDVVRVPFPYTDRDTRQHRPALVVSAGGVGDGEVLLWVVMITSAANRPWPGDVALGSQYREAGLPAPSTIRPCKIATIEARHAQAIGRIGSDQLADIMATLNGYLRAR